MITTLPEPLVTVFAVIGVVTTLIAISTGLAWLVVIVMDKLAARRRAER